MLRIQLGNRKGIIIKFPTNINVAARCWKFKEYDGKLNCNSKIVALLKFVINCPLS